MVEQETLGLIFRFAERWTIVAIGGFSFYLGYRLFVELPIQRNQTGEINLPGIKVVLSKVAPGVFFAAFGAIIVSYSLAQPFEKTGQNEHIRYAGPSADLAAADDPSNLFDTSKKQPEPSVTPQQRSQTLVAIETLNCLDRMAKRNESIKSDAALAIRQAKVVLLHSIWDDEKWGSVTTLRETGPSQQAHLEVQNAYQALSTCPY